MTGRPHDTRRGDPVLLADMEEAVVMLEGLRERGREPFLADPYAQAAAVRFMEILGEAAGNLSLSFRSRNPDFPVRNLRGFASFAKHEYWRVQSERLWAAIAGMPELRRALVKVRADAPSRNARNE